MTKKILWLFLFLFVFLYSISQSYSLVITDIERIAYLAFVAVFIAISLISSERFEKQEGVNLWVSIVIFIYFVSRPLFSEDLVFYYYFRDIAIAVLWIASYFLVDKSSVVFSDRFWWITLFALVFLAVASFLWNMDSRRFEPPELIVVPLVIMLSKASSRLFFKIASVFMIFCIVGLAFRSGERTALILSVTAVFISLWAFSEKGKKVVVYFPVLAIAVYSLFMSDEILSTLSGTRFERISQGAVDGSIMQRLNEASDVFYTWLDYDFLAQLLGEGAGGLYMPDLVISEKMLVDTTQGVQIYHVHSTPFFLLLKFGIIGFISYFYFFFVSIKNIMKTSKSAVLELTMFRKFISVSLVLYLVSGMFFLLPFEPWFWLLLSISYFLNKGMLGLHEGRGH